MMGRLIQRTVIGGMAILLAVLVPAVQVLGAAADGSGAKETEAVIQKTRAVEPTDQESLEEENGRLEEAADPPEREEAQERESGENMESASVAESSGKPDYEESGSSGTLESEMESSLSGEGDGQTKAESQSGQESKETEPGEQESATESSAGKAEAGKTAKVFFEGQGTEEAPFLIGTAKELEKLAELMASDYENYGNRHYRLTQNIQMKKGRNNHKAIGSTEHPFMGEFDGDGYVISRIKINRPRLEAQGLFGVVGTEGAVRNVGLTENIICGGDYVGAIAGINNGTIESCFQTGEVYGVNNNVGSLIGQNQGRVADCYSTGLVCGGYRIGDYIPETEGEEKGRKAGRGGFRDFIQTIAETIAETVAETVAYVIEETKAGLETLYEMVTTTLSAEGGPGVQGTEESDLGVQETQGKGPGIQGPEEEGSGVEESEEESTVSGIVGTSAVEPEITEEAEETGTAKESEATKESDVTIVPEVTETSRNDPSEAGTESAETWAEAVENGVTGQPSENINTEKMLNTYGQMNGEVIAEAKEAEKAKVVEEAGSTEKTKGAEEAEKPKLTEESKGTENPKTSEAVGATEDSKALEETEDTKYPKETKEEDRYDETEEDDEPDETEEETEADETDGELINDLPGSEDMLLTEEEQAALKVLGGIVGRNLGGSVERCFQAGRRVVKSTEWTSGGIAGFSYAGQIDSCYYVWPSTLEKPEQEYEGVNAVSTELLTGGDAAGRLGLDSDIWSSRETEEDQRDGQTADQEAGAGELIRYRHYYPQPSVFADRGQPYQYTLGYIETDGLRVDTLTKRAYVSTEEAFAWLFEGTEYLDYEIKLEADLNLESFGTSIGTMEQPFTGILDGDGHVISGLRQPLFQVLGDGSAVYYLLLDQADVRKMGLRAADEYGPEANVSGVLAGYSRNAVIDSCGAVGMIHLSAGGSSRPVYIGGLIGMAGPGTSIYESYTFVNIAEDLGEGSRVTTGGLVGFMDQDAGANNCYATGRLESGGITGGFAGENRGEIRDSFVTTIIGTMAKKVGAFVGTMPEAGDLPERKTDIQETEIVPLQEISEGEAGNNSEAPSAGDSSEDLWVKTDCTITGCAYDVQMSGCGDDYAQGMLTGEMSGETAALPGGDWYTTDGAYPQLKCMALHTHETYLLRSKASAIPLILPSGIYITDIPKGEGSEEPESEIRISGSVEMGVPAQIDGDEIQWSEAERVKLQGDGTAVLQMD